MGGGAMLTLPVAGSAAAVIDGGAPTTNLHSVSVNLPVSANCITPLRPFCSNNKFGESEPWIRLDRREDERASGSVSGAVPTRTEVEKAISDLQRQDVEELMMLFACSKQIPRFRMPTSGSIDKAAWDAMLNKNAVLNLRDSLGAGFCIEASHPKEGRPESSTSEEPDLATLLLNWILEITKAKVLELTEQFSSLVNTIFQPPDTKKVAAEITDDQLVDKLDPRCSSPLSSI
ncbi:DM7 family protein [Actinidia chinensis var. chinensis]|uniref:DM7 family protein n=1 Tax=Actinidia chinensis var. chinensis TaxID=1590841 RepID=A0A2R6QPI2_ACTCC|nr:DM7 family protein [Actinidia chinensis var. chinensis]